MKVVMRGSRYTVVRPGLQLSNRHIIVMASAMAGAICLLTGVTISQHPGVQPWEVQLFTPAGLALLLNASLVCRRIVSETIGSAAVLSVLAALLMLRVVMVFVDDTFDNPAQGMFLPVFGYFGSLPLLMVILLPYPASAWCSVAAWLLFAGVTTAGVWPHANDQPARPFLAATLIYVWFGNGLFIILLLGWIRAKHRLVASYRQLAEIEHESRTAMAESERRFRSVYENSTVGIGLLGTDECWTDVNTRMAELTGYSIDELRGMPLRNLVPPDERHLPCERGRALLSGDAQQDGYSIQRRWLRKDGSVCWLLHHVRRMAADASRPPTLLVMSIDISDRVAAEQLVAEHERVREFHFTNTPLAVIEWTPDLRIKRWSNRAEAIFGWREDEIVGNGISDWRFVHDDDVAAVQAVVELMTGGRDSLVTTQNRNYRRDGSVVWCEWYNSILRDAAGHPISMISLVQDITEQRLAMTALDWSERKLRGFFEQAAVGMSLLNADGTWNTVNQRLCTLTGYSRDELLSMDYRAITLPADREVDLDRATALIEGRINDYEIEKRFVHKQGAVIWVKVTATRLCLAADQPPLYVAVVEDISKRKQAELTVRELASDLERKVRERTAQLQQSIGTLAQRNQEQRVLGDMMTRLPEAASIEECGRVIEQFLPTIFQHYGGVIWLQMTTGGALSRLAQWGGIQDAPHQIACTECEAIQLGDVLRIDDPGHPHLCTHLHGLHARNAVRPHCCAPIIALGETVGLLHLEWSEALQVKVMPPDPVTVANCVKKIGLAIGHVRLREELRRQAIRDPLTGLYNRRHFDDVLLRRIADHQRSGRTFALLMIDIDHFKRINDQFGHQAGDDVLRAVAERLQRSVRIDEGAFRLGGEEFVLMIDDTGVDVAAGCAERMRREIAAMPVRVGERELPPITISVGVASYPRDVTAHGSLLQRADSALYAAKCTGRNRVCIAGTADRDEMATSASSSRSMEPDGG